MREIFTLCFLALLSTTGNGQRAVDIQKIPSGSLEEQLQGVIGCGIVRNLPVRKDTVQTLVIRSCRPIINYNQPLYIIDGIPVEAVALSELNPNDIESITVLKDIQATVLYGCRASNGVIIIETKSSRLRQFMVKDFLDGSAVPGATVTFTSGTDTLMFAADEDGIIEASVLKPGAGYEVKVSGVGYKQFISRFQNGYKKKQELLLEREVKVGEAVVISGNYLNMRRFLCGFAGIAVGVISDQKKQDDATTIHSITALYPNPAQRGQTITIQTLSDVDNNLRLQVTDLTGRTVYTRAMKTFKGDNRFTVTADNRWTAGMYIVSLLDEKGRKIQQEKLLIQ